VLYSTRAGHIDAIQRLGNVQLEVIAGKAPKLEGAVRSTPDFDLVLNMPEAAGQKERLEKENEQLEKQIASLDQQLSNEEFLKKAPAKVIESMRAKKAEYEARLKKNRGDEAAA